mgnify:CR=1 FL=1|jgi:hypothetical protein
MFEYLKKHCTFVILYDFGKFHENETYKTKKNRIDKIGLYG